MSQRDDYEPGVPCWIDTLQPDPEAAMAFYGALFGWEFAGPGPMGYRVARLRGRDVAGIGAQPADGPAPPPAWTTYVYVESADETAERGPQRRRRRPGRGLRRASGRSAGHPRRSGRAPRSAHGSPRSARARSSSTSPERGR